MGKREIVIPYSPREPQQQIHDAMRSNRFVVVVAHRRMGKTVAAVNELIRAAIECPLERPRLAYIGPTYTQAKSVAWDYVKHFARPLGAEVNESEMRVDFWGRRIRLYGADNYDALRGNYFDLAVIDETGMQDPRAWNEVIRPALADRQGKALFLGTPAGINHFKDLRDRAESEPGWKLLEFKASETGLVDPEELKAARREMGDAKYLQEFECSFDAPIEGAYYGQLLADADEAGRLCSVPFDNIARTLVAWDLGMGDSTAMWVAQCVGREVRLIDFHENHGVGLDHYVTWLRDNGYHHAEQILPHDVQVRELGSGKSRLEMLREAGLDCTVAARLGVDDGIAAVRRLLPRCWFDKGKTKQGLDALRNYRREYDDRRKVFYDRPLHDWSSHASDAFRYLAVGLNEASGTWGKPVAVNTKWVV